MSWTPLIPIHPGMRSGTPTGSVAERQPTDLHPPILTEVYMYKCRSVSPIAIIGAVVVGLAALAGCAPTPTLHSDYDRGADFSSYRTYAYANPVGTDKAGYSSLITLHFKTAIDAEMSAR